MRRATDRDEEGEGEEDGDEGSGSPSDQQVRRKPKSIRHVSTAIAFPKANPNFAEEPEEGGGEPRAEPQGRRGAGGVRVAAADAGEHPYQEACCGGRGFQP